MPIICNYVVYKNCGKKLKLFKGTVQ
jgi:hypothetical protein